MPKPALIENPRKVTLYLPEAAVARGRTVAETTGVSLSALVTDLLNNHAGGSRKVRVHADFPSEEYDEIKRSAESAGMSVEDFVRTATYQLIN